MATKLDRIQTYLKQLLPINLLDLLVMSSCEITWQTKKLRLHCHRNMATKLARLETYPEGLLSYSHTTFNQMILLDHVTIWKTYASLSQDLWPLNLIECCQYRGASASERLSRHRHLVKKKLMISTKFYDSFDYVWTFFDSSSVCAFLNVHRDIFAFCLLWKKTFV